MMNRLRLIYGLGNPGLVYEGTRHNLGAQAILFFTQAQGISWRLDKQFGLWMTEPVSWTGASGQKAEIVFLRSNGFMNLSGQPLRKFLDYHPLKKEFKVEDLLVVHDEARLFLGEACWQKAGPLRGQNGLKSIAAALGSEGFDRLRLGVAGEKCNQSMADYADRISGYVLGKFDAGEREKIFRLFPLVVQGLRKWIEEEQTTNFFLPDEPLLG